MNSILNSQQKIYLNLKSFIFSLIFNKKTKAVNYNIDTYKKKIYIYGIAETKDERDEVIKEAKEILDVEDVIASILLVEDLRIQKLNYFL